MVAVFSLCHTRKSRLRHQLSPHAPNAHYMALRNRSNTTLPHSHLRNQ
uniref:Uncharacterized protein n=1 Tax=Setaria digitata TaxID=48799 RepID=A0A915PXB0_9BILA